MPKRHRQPEPIDIESTAHHRSQAARDASVGASSPAYSPGELKLVEETRRRAQDFPATPETLSRHRRQLEADAKRRRVSYDKDGQLVNGVGAGPGTGRDGATALAGAAELVPPSSGVAAAGKPLAERGAPRTSASAPAAAVAVRAVANGDTDSDDADGNAYDEAAEESVDGVDFSSADYIGDDGNQESSDDSALGDSEDDSAAAEEEAELRQLRRALAAAAAAAAHRRCGGGAGETEGSGPVSPSEDGSDEVDSVDTSSISGASASLEQAEDEEEDDGDDSSDEEGDVESDEEGTGHGRRDHTGDTDADDDDVDGEGSADDGELVTVDFGVFDMEASNVDGLLHLMDQLCPDKMNEVDRDALGLALLESPFTSVVRLQNNGEDASGEEAQEFYGLSSVLDVAHGQALYPAALRVLCELLQQHVWRQAASGIPPTDILSSVADGGRVATSRAKCLLLVSEYIRNIPLELTVQILEDVLDRLDAAAAAAAAGTAAAATHAQPIFATHPSMFAVLAKVQRATDAPVTLPKPASTQAAADGAGSSEGGAPADKRPPSNSGVHQRHKGRHDRAATAAASGGSGGAVMGPPESLLDLRHYIFWREEDSILYEFRDKRVAALVYRCRPQYDGQPEHEIPFSVLFVLQYGAVRQAVDEMKRRQTVSAAVERY